MSGERIREPLDNLIDVGIVEINAFKLAVDESRRDFEVVNALGFRFASLNIVRHGDDAVSLDARRPEIIV